MALAGVGLPWATRDTVVNGEGGAVPIHSWSRLPLLMVVILAMAIVPICIGLSKLETGLPLHWNAARLLPASGGLMVVSLVAWMVAVVRETDPARIDRGYEGTRTVPWIGAGLVLCGALAIGISGIIVRPASPQRRGLSRGDAP